MRGWAAAVGSKGTMPPGASLQLAVLILTLVPWFLPSRAEAGPANSRHDFARALRRVANSLREAPENDRPSEGLAASRVLALLGKPDEVRAWQDAHRAGTERPVIWCYGVTSPGGFATLGRVAIGSKGLAALVYGGHGTPPHPNLMGELELRRLLGVLDRLPGPMGWSTANPLSIIQAVNAFQPLGKNRALGVIAEYVRLNHTMSSPWEAFNDCPFGLYPVVRLLFTIPADREELFITTHDIQLLEDVPLTGGGGGGAPGVRVGEEDLQNFRKFGTIRSRPLRPPDRPWELLTRLETTPSWPEATAAQQSYREFVADQILWLLHPVYRTAMENQELQFPRGEKFTAWWDGVVKDLEKLNIRWDTRNNTYVCADGAQLPNPTAPRRDRLAPGSARMAGRWERQTHRGRSGRGHAALETSRLCISAL